MGEPSVVVCVTTQKACERLILAGYEAAERLQLPLHVLHVASAKQSFFNNKDQGAALEYLFDISRKYNADMAVEKSENVAETIVEFVRNNSASLVVFGQSGDFGEGTGIIEAVRRELSKYGIPIAVQSRD